MLPKKFKIDWSEREKNKKTDNDVKTQMSDVKKLVFCSVLFSFKFCSYYQDINKKVSDFLIFQKIRVTISLDGTSILMQKPVLFQV